jgi:hypothetical protein
MASTVIEPMSFRFLLLILLAVIIPSSAGAQETGGHVALLVANASYRSLPARVGMGSEVYMLAEALRAAGYRTIICRDPDPAQLEREFDKVSQTVSPDDVFFFYWSGYGAHVDGIDYLLSAGISSPARWEGGKPSVVGGVALGALLDRVSRLDVKARIVAIEAQRLAGESPLFPPATVPRDMLVALSQPTVPLDLFAARDGGLFAAVLAGMMAEADGVAAETFARVRLLVAARSGDGNLPWVGSGLTVPVSLSAQNSRRFPSGAPYVGLFPIGGLSGWGADGILSDTLDYFSVRDRQSFGRFGPSLRPEPNRNLLDYLPTSAEIWGGAEVGLREVRVGNLAGSYGEAVKWYERNRPESGGARPEFELGRVFAEGRGVPQDNRVAERWFLKASELGDAEAQYRLALLLRGVDGVNRDDIEAFRWFHRAADHGNAAAMAELGTSYLKGLGVSPDQVEAMVWYRRGADLGDADAMHSLALGYATGAGVVKNCVDAKDWLSRAANAGHRLADQELHSTLGACAWF